MPEPLANLMSESSESNANSWLVHDRHGALIETRLPIPSRRGKVRDVYDLGDELLIVSSDRISAFDYILPTGIPGKGKLLTAMSVFWLRQINVPNHLIDEQIPEELLTALGRKGSSEQVDAVREALRGRVMRTRKAQVYPFECVVRGYLEGSGWKEYESTGAVCGVSLPDGLQRCARLSEPIFTPATKAETGHDENVPFSVMAQRLGRPLADELKTLSLRIYQTAADIADKRGILIADTKFEFGEIDGQIHLIDEVLTPDSSRFWDLQSYQPGRTQPAMDKQFVREYLLSCDWDRNSPPPPLPETIVQQTLERYRSAFERLTG